MNNYLKNKLRSKDKQKLKDRLLNSRHKVDKVINNLNQRGDSKMVNEVNKEVKKILMQNKDKDQLDVLNKGNLNQKIQMRENHQADLNKDPQSQKIPMESKDKDQLVDLNKSHPSLNNLKMENKENQNKMEKNKLKNKENKRKNKKVKYQQPQLQ